jgi:hypothetical protein
MLKRLTIVAAGLCLVATTGQAQLTKDVLKCESGTGKALSKFTGSKSKCVSKCLSTARKTMGPFGGCLPPYADPTASACITGSLKGAEAKAGATIAKGCAAAASCPACYVTEFSPGACTDASGGNPFVQFVEGLFDVLPPNVYCVEQGGGTPSKTDAKCEDSLAKALVKFVGSKAKCYDKCVATANKAGMSGTAFGCDPPATETATMTCVATATTKSNASIDKACFTPPATFPSCYDGSGFRPNTSAGWTALAEGSVDATTSKVFCPKPPPTKLAFTNMPGTTGCGGITAGVTFTPPATAPFSGEIDSDLACSVKIADLGLGCLYIGGGGATSVPPGATPNGATNIFDISGPNLVASNGTSNLNCTKGAGPTSHCIGGTNFGTACTLDSQCGGNVGSCGLDPNCFFAGPLPILNGPLSTCVVNVIATDAGGTGDITTGTSSVNIPLASRTYLTGNSASPCPKCVSGLCAGGLNNGGACSAGSNTLGTSQDCPPANSTWLATLSVGLNPLTTGTATKTGAAGNFCPSPPATDPQQTGGAFGKTTAQCIKEVGSPAGDLRNGAPHPSKLASVFCIPKTGNPAIDPAANLPGPGAFSITGNAQGLP